MQEPLPDLTTPVPVGNTYTSRPTTVTAEQWDGTEEHARILCEWADSYRGRGSACFIDGHKPLETGYVDASGAPVTLERPAHIVIGTLEGNMKLEEGSWLIKGTEDEFYPCKDSVFQAKYRRLIGHESWDADRIKSYSEAPHILIQNGKDVG